MGPGNDQYTERHSLQAINSTNTGTAVVGGGIQITAASKKLAAKELDYYTSKKKKKNYKLCSIASFAQQKTLKIP